MTSPEQKNSALSPVSPFSLNSRDEDFMLEFSEESLKAGTLPGDPHFINLDSCYHSALISTCPCKLRFMGDYYWTEIGTGFNIVPPEAFLYITFLPFEFFCDRWLLLPNVTLPCSYLVSYFSSQLAVHCRPVQVSSPIALPLTAVTPEPGPLYGPFPSQGIDSVWMTDQYCWLTLA